MPVEKFFFGLTRDMNTNPTRSSSSKRRGRGRANFGELRTCELRGISLPRTPMNKPRSRLAGELIKVDQHDALSVSWQLIPLVAH